MSATPGGSSTGKQFKAYWSVSPADGVLHPIGNIRSLNASTDGRITREEDSGNRTPFIKQGTVRPNVRITFDVVRTNFITRRCMMNGNADVPLTRILWYDGQAWFQISGYADSCRLRTSPGEMLQCDVTLRGDEIRTASSDTCSGWNEDPLTHENISTFSVGGSGITNWERLEWGVENQVNQVALGTSIIPTEVFDQAARHTGSYRISRRWTGTKFDESQTGVGQDIVIAVTDKQSPAITTTFTYPSGIIRTASVEDRDLDLIWESGDWEAETVTIS